MNDPHRTNNQKIKQKTAKSGKNKQKRAKSSKNRKKLPPDKVGKRKKGAKTKNSQRLTTEKTTIRADKPPPQNKSHTKP